MEFGVSKAERDALLSKKTNVGEQESERKLRSFIERVEKIENFLGNDYVYIVPESREIISKKTDPLYEKYMFGNNRIAIVSMNAQFMERGMENEERATELRGCINILKLIASEIPGERIYALEQTLTDKEAKNSDFDYKSFGILTPTYLNAYAPAPVNIEDRGFKDNDSMVLLRKTIEEIVKIGKAEIKSRNKVTLAKASNF